MGRPAPSVVDCSPSFGKDCATFVQPAACSAGREPNFGIGRICPAEQWETTGEEYAGGEVHHLLSTLRRFRLEALVSGKLGESHSEENGRRRAPEESASGRPSHNRCVCTANECIFFLAS